MGLMSISTPTPDALSGRVALVTGVSREIGIAAEIVRRLLRDGAAVFASGWPAHDAELHAVTDRFVDANFGHDRYCWQADDLGDPDVPARLVDQVIERFGGLDIVVATHARSSTNNLEQVTASELDQAWAVNARANVLLAQALLRATKAANGGETPIPRYRRFVMFTSGQAEGPMDAEIAYAVSKGAVHQSTISLANALADDGITVNTINPGPVDTGYATGEAHRAVEQAFPAGRWGQPDDTAKLVAWLVSAEADWITGQVVNSEGGWRRWEVNTRGPT